MASLIDTLIDVLDKENTEYEALLKLSEEKPLRLYMAMLRNYKRFSVQSKSILIR